MYGFGYGWSWISGIFMMLIPLVIFGLVVYWATKAGVKDAIKAQSMQILNSGHAQKKIISDEHKELKEPPAEK